MITKYYRHPYIYRSNSADKETYRVEVRTTMNKYEMQVNTGRTSIEKKIEQSEWSQTKLENSIETKTGKTTGCSNT